MKKLCAVFLTLLVLFGVVFALPISAEADTDTMDYSWYTPNGGTKDAPYEIANAAQWVTIYALSNGIQEASDTAVKGSVDFDGKYFELTGDIDLSGYVLLPINRELTIHLDGKGHTISHATFGTSPAALFTELGRHSTISNIVFEDIDIDVDGPAAILALNAKAGISCYNLHVKDTCSVVAGGNAAGLIANLVDNEDVTDDDRINFRFCVNEADVTGAATVGGLVANLQGSYDYNFDFCVNKGDITATSEAANNAVGGLFGNFSRRSDEYLNAGTITNCYNTGLLTTCASAHGYSFCGGLFGCLRAGTGSEVNMENCYDYSARKGVNASTRHRNGGVFGYADNVQLIKIMEYCYGANRQESVRPYTSVLAWTVSMTSVVYHSDIVDSITDEILTYREEFSTMQAEMAAIDAGIATLTRNELSFITKEEQDNCSHRYDNDCDGVCNLCRYVRFSVIRHDYENECDRDCNSCGAVRVAPHQYTAPCDIECDLCFEVRQTASAHRYDGCTDGDCNNCAATRPTKEHNYTSDQDAECNDCGFVRELASEDEGDDPWNKGDSAPTEDETRPPVEEEQLPPSQDLQTPSLEDGDDEIITLAPPTEQTDKAEPTAGCGAALGTNAAAFVLALVLGMLFLTKKKSRRATTK